MPEAMGEYCIRQTSATAARCFAAVAAPFGSATITKRLTRPNRNASRDLAVSCCAGVCLASSVSADRSATTHLSPTTVRRKYPGLSYVPGYTARIDFSLSRDATRFFFHRKFVPARPYISETHLDGSAEFVIVACDGVWDVLNDQDAVDFVRPFMNNNIPPTEWPDLAQKLVAEALRRGSTDNITAMIIYL